MIRVLLVDDSPLMLTVLQQQLERPGSGIQVVATAANGREALARLTKTAPDVILSDIYMPVMDGLALTEAVMRDDPRPILIVSIAVERGSGDDMIFRALAAGAVDVFAKPRDTLNAPTEAMAQALINKVRVLAGVRVVTRRTPATRAPAPVPVRSGQAVIGTPRIIVMGASTGGPQTYLHILSALAGDFSVPIVCVQHIGEGFNETFLHWLSQNTPLRVGVAQVGEIPQPGQVYFPPEDRHLIFDKAGRFQYHPGQPGELHRPSVSTTFQAAAAVFGARTLGILLTGMGRDGAEGLLAIRRAGGETWAQDEASSVVFGMPKAAIDLDAAQQILPLTDIPALLSRLARPTSLP
ncbi:Protein-glutamate methylesterase/protein-glutamine glutaminase 3 [Gammaproteobacteria bacterium]